MNIIQDVGIDIHTILMQKQAHRTTSICRYCTCRLTSTLYSTCISNLSFYKYWTFSTLLKRKRRTQSQLEQLKMYMYTIYHIKIRTITVNKT